MPTITIYRDQETTWEKWNTMWTRETSCADVVEVSEAVCRILEREDERSEKHLEKIVRGLKGF